MPEKVYRYWNNEMLEDVTPLKYGDKDLAAVIGWGGVQIFDPAVDIVELCYEYAKSVQGYSCGQCTPCRAGTRVIQDLLGKIREGYGRENDLDLIKSLAQTISEASMCEIGKSSPPVFIHMIDTFRDEFVKAIQKKETKSNGYQFGSIVTAPCQQACPIHLNIPKYIEEIKFGRYEDSLNVIRERLPLPGVVGRVCVRPCEFNCRRALIDEPIQIKHLKRFVADFELERGGCPLWEQGSRNNIRVAIVGAGPAGVTCACFLAQMGYDVTIYEMLPEPGGMAAVGIPDYRLPRHVLQGEVKNVEDLGVKIEYGKALGIHFTLEDLEKEGFKAIFIGMGCHCHKAMGVEGEDKGYEGYMPGVYFLRNANLGLLDELPKGTKIAVVGGGNVAIDCVRMAFRLGFDDSNIVYRRTEKEMPADEIEIRDAKAEGVKFHFLTAPKRIVAEDGKVKGLECFKMELGEPDKSGRRKPVPVPDSDFIIEADVIIPAIGQEGDYSCMCNLPGVEVTKWGALIVNDFLMSSRKGVFAGGDCVTGPDVLIRACAQGRLTAFRIDKFLKEGTLDFFEEELNEKLIKNLKIYDPSEKVALPGGVPRMPIKHEPAEERKKDFREVDKGFTTDEAKAEASRCLRCYRVVTFAKGK